MFNSLKILLIACALSVTMTAHAAGELKKIRFGVEGAYPPLSFVDATGKLQGFDIEFGYALCEQLKVECQMIQQDWDGLIPALMAKKFDAILASMNITEERKQKVDFTKKYYISPAKFVKRKQANITISKEGLKGKVIGAQRATIHDNFVTDNYQNVAEIKRYNTVDEAYLDLQAGRIDVLIADSIALDDGFLKTAAGQPFEFVGPDLTDPKWFGEGMGIAVRKGDTMLRDKLNGAIDELRQSDKYKALQDKYFTFDVSGESVPKP